MKKHIIANFDKINWKSLVHEDGFEPPTFGYGITLSQPHVHCSDQLSYSRIEQVMRIELTSEDWKSPIIATILYLHARFFTESLTLTCGSRRSFHSVTYKLVTSVGYPQNQLFPPQWRTCFPAWIYTIRNAGWYGADLNCRPFDFQSNTLPD